MSGIRAEFLPLAKASLSMTLEPLQLYVKRQFQLFITIRKLSAAGFRLESTEKNQPTDSCHLLKFLPRLEIRHAFTESETATKTWDVSARIRVTGFAQTISMDCQEDLNHIARGSLKCSPAGLWSKTVGMGVGCGCCTAVHLQSLHLGGKTDLRGPPHPKNVKLLQCDARQSLERKLRKFSGCSFRCLHAYYSILFSKENDLTAIAR